MAGTKIGGLKAARTNMELYGKDFYRRIGTKGGRISSRKGIKNGEGKWIQHKNTYKIIKDGKVITKINVKYVRTN